MASTELGRPTKESERTVEVRIIGPWKKRWTEEEAVKKLIDLEPRVYNGIQVNFAPGAEDAIARAVSYGITPAIYMNHQSQYDGPAVGRATREILKVVKEANPSFETQGFMAPIASSIATGDQDQVLRQFFEAVRPRMENDGIFMTDFTREKDEQKYNIARTNELLHEYNVRMKGFFQDGFLPAIWPETKLDGGRENWERQQVGMIPFEKSALRRLARLAIFADQDPSFIPVAISGSYKILSPDGHRPPDGIVLRAKSGVLPMGIVRINIGHPINWNDLIEQRKTNNLPVTDEALNDFYGEQLANLLPFSERGIHKTNPDGSRPQQAFLTRGEILDVYHGRK